MTPEDMLTNCHRTGMFEGLGFKLWNYEVEFDDIGAEVFGIDDLSFSTWNWSPELALAASYYLDDLQGCNVYQPLIIDDGEANDYLAQIASFT